MTHNANLAAELRAACPSLRGSLAASVPLAPMTWFRCGGPAEAFFEPADEEDLAAFLASCPTDCPLHVIGSGSNLLIRDGGIDGVVIRLGRAFATVDVDGDRIEAGAALPDVKLASAALQAGLTGFSFLRGIPGSIGGALRMNAGAYGREIADCFLSATGFDRDGVRHSFDREAMHFSYRHCGVAGDILFTSAQLGGTSGDPDRIRDEMAAITAARNASQPVNTPTGGSTFKNPKGAKAWELIDAAGCRGLTLGNAQVSPLHTNFLINRGNATAAEIEGLGEEVRRRVQQTSGILLEWEIARIGRTARGMA